MWRAVIGFVWWVAAGSAWAQDLCMDQLSTVLPENTLSKYKEFGFNFDLSGDALVVTESQSDIQAYRGGAVHVYLYANETWSREATILAQTPTPGLQLGREVALRENALAAIARPQNPSGKSQDILYVFDKSPETPWGEVQEVYAGPIDSSIDGSELLNVVSMDFEDDLLAISYVSGNEPWINVYHYEFGESLELITTLQPPADASGALAQNLQLTLASGFLVVGVPDFKEEDNNSSGRVFIYERLGDGSMTVNPVATLLPTLPGQQRFGSRVATSDNDIVVACDYGTENGRFEPKAFVYEQPNQGWAGTINEVAVLRTGQTGSYFTGVVLAANDNYVFYGKSIEAAVSVFKRTADSWTDQGRAALLLSPVIGLNYGDQIRSNNDHLVLNLPGDLTGIELNEQEVYTYEPPGGAFDNIQSYGTLLTPGDSSATEDLFGSDMATAGSWMAVSAAEDDTYGPSSGAVYLFKRSITGGSWNLQQVLRSPSERPYEHFGSTLHLTEEALFVTAQGHNEGQGIVYQYRRDGDSWRLTGSLRSPEITVPGTLIDNSRKGFGRDITSIGNTLAISQFNTGNSEDRGRVHLFESTEEDSWVFLGSLRPEEETQFDWFGREIIMNDSLVVVGTGGSGRGAPSQMAVYVYRKKNGLWQGATEDARLVSSDQQTQDQFGYSIALYDDQIVVGAIGREPNYAGGAYLFQRPPQGWTGTLNETAILSPQDVVEGDYFGYEVYIDSRYILVGAPHSLGDEQSSPLELRDRPGGKVYFFDRRAQPVDGVLRETAILEPAATSPADAFGKSIVSNGAQILISAPRASTQVGTFSGAVYEWEQIPLIELPVEAICEDGNPIQLSVKDGLYGVWGGEGITDSLTGTFDPSGLETGNYQVTFNTVECQAAAFLFVAKRPEILSRTEPSVGICAGGRTTLQATFDRYPEQLEWYYRPDAAAEFQTLGEGRSANQIEAELPGEYQLAYGNRGCVDFAQFEVFLSEENKPVVLNQAPAEVEVCEGISAELFVEVDNLAASSFVWSFRPDSTQEFVPIQQAEDVPNLAATEPGQYRVEISNQLCVEERVFTTTARAVASDIEVSGDWVLCDGETMTLTLSAEGEVDAYQWKTRPSTSSEYQPIASDGGILSLANPGSYFCEFEQEGCLFRSDTVEIVSPPVEVTLEFEAAVCSQSQIVELSATPEGGEWFLDGAPIGTTLDAGNLANGAYELVYRVEQLGCTLEKSDVLRVSILAQGDVPNAFSPNGDGINDVFEIGWGGGLPSYEFQVFDRSGNSLFHSADGTRPWTGGEEPTGTYYWSLSYFDECESNPVRRSGTVYLLR